MGEARRKRGIQSGSKPQAFAVWAQEPRRPLQAAGEAVLEAVPLASTVDTTLGARIPSCGGVLQEEDRVLQYLRFLHPALAFLLSRKTTS